MGGHCCDVISRTRVALLPHETKSENSKHFPPSLRSERPNLRKTQTVLKAAKGPCMGTDGEGNSVSGRSQTLNRFPRSPSVGSCLMCHVSFGRRNPVPSFDVICTVFCLYCCYSKLCLLILLCFEQTVNG